MTRLPVHTDLLPCSDLIPLETRGALLCLKSEDHYLRVYTDCGDTLVLFKLGDAVASLPSGGGLQVHRSYWVARRALKKARRQSRRQYLDLVNGLSVPVSRSRVPELRAAGWLVSPRSRKTETNSVLDRLRKLALSPFQWQRPAVLGAALATGMFIGMGVMAPHVAHQESGGPSAAETAFASGWREYLRDTPEFFARAAGHFQRAVAIDANYGRAYGALASLYHAAAVRGWNRRWGMELHETYRLAHQNLVRAARFPSAEGHAAEAQGLLHRRHVEEAMVEASRAIAADPKNPAGHLWMANALIMTGLPNQAEAFLDKARALGHPGSPSTLWARGMAAFVREDFNASANYFEQCLEQSPAMDSMALVAAYGHLGRIEDAQRIIAREHAKRNATNPLNLVTVMDGMIFERKEDAKRFIAGLKRAGL